LKLYEKKYPEETSAFFKNTFSYIIEQALNLPQYLTKPIPLLGKYMNMAITINRLQVNIIYIYNLSIKISVFINIIKNRNEMILFCSIF